MEGIITFILVLIAFDVASISSKLDKINKTLINSENQNKIKGDNNG